MADMVTQKDIVAYETIRLASSFAGATAAGAGNAVAVSGLTFQRSLIGMPRAAALTLAFSGTLTATKTLALSTVKIQDSADGATFADYLLFTDPGVVATGPAGGGVVQGQVTLAAYLEGARDFLRIVFTPTLSATATDTATVLGILAFAGFDRLPAAA